MRMRGCRRHPVIVEKIVMGSSATDNVTLLAPGARFSTMVIL